MSRLASTIEAILYLKAQPLSIAEIAEAAACDRDSAEEGLLELMADYAHRDSALEIVETPNGHGLQLREAFQHLVQIMVPADLGIGELRTLAAVAIKGPIAQTDLVELRGSGAYQHVKSLFYRDLFANGGSQTGDRTGFRSQTNFINIFNSISCLRASRR